MALFDTRERLNIGLVNTLMYSEVERIFLDNAIRSLSPLCSKLFVIAGNFNKKYSIPNVTILNFTHRHRYNSLPFRLIDYLRSQLQLVYEIAKIHGKINALFFDVGEYRNAPSIAFAKLLGTKIAVFHHGGNKFLEAKYNYTNGIEKFIPPVQEGMLRFCYDKVDYVLILSFSIIEFGGLQKYRKKCLLFRSFIDTKKYDRFPLEKARENIVGYFGRLTPKKGILNFLESIPFVISKYPDAKFVIAGSGEQREAVQATIKSLSLSQKILLLPWIPDEEFPVYLSKLKVFVLPSYEEGMPATMLEAMAAGCIVVATKVGGIPDVLNAKTGFLIAKNDPCSISEAIIAALNCKDSTMSSNAREFIQQEYSFSAVLNQWNYTLSNICRNA
jgi:glycosyltransferase involved in cell wall biosynthesis